MGRKPIVTPDRICEMCGGSYRRNQQNIAWFMQSRFCGIPCRIRATRELPDYWAKKPRPRKTCIECGKEFEMVGNYTLRYIASRKFCGMSCRDAYTRQEKHHNWRGGTFLIDKGYYKRSMGDGTSQYEHRVVAARVLGRPLKRSETVHHINGDKTDNRHCNLIICSNKYHRELHERMSHLYQQEHFREVTEAEPDLTVADIMWGHDWPHTSAIQ